MCQRGLQTAVSDAFGLGRDVPVGHGNAHRPLRSVDGFSLMIQGGAGPLFSAAC